MGQVLSEMARPLLRGGLQAARNMARWSEAKPCQFLLQKVRRGRLRHGTAAPQAVESWGFAELIRPSSSNANYSQQEPARVTLGRNGRDLETSSMVPARPG